MSKHMSLIFLNLRCSVTDATESGKRFQVLTTLHAKLFRLLRVLPICYSSLIDALLSPGLLENLNNCVASWSTWLYSILWVRTKKSLRLLFSRGCCFRAWSRSSYVRALRPFTHRVAALCILSTWFMSFVRYGRFGWMGYSRWGRTKAMYRGTKIAFVRQVNDLFMKYNIPLALLVAARTLAERETRGAGLTRARTGTRPGTSFS